MNETGWTHIGIVASVLIPLVLFWLDIKRSREKQHQENLTRLTAIETMLEPLWDWWNSARRNGGHQEEKK